MSKKTNSNKKLLSSLLTGIYLFAILFSGYFHTHSNYFKENSIVVKNVPVSNKFINFGGLDNCFSSHFFNAGIGILESKTNFHFFFLLIFSHSEFFFKISGLTEKILSFSLRAPPYFI